MTNKGTHTLGLKPVERKDLMDFFPSLASAFAGYIRQAVFRDTLHGILVEVQKETENEMRQYGDGGCLTNNFRDANYRLEAEQRVQDLYFFHFREKLFYRIEKTDWYHWKNEENYAKRSEEQVYRYAKAAVFAGAMHFVNKGIGKVTEKWSGELMDKGMKKWKPVEKMGNIFRESADMVTKKTNKLIEPSIDPLGSAVGKIIDWMGPDGVDTDFNNRDTRSFYAQKLHVNEWIVGWGLESLDFGTDWVKFAPALKALEASAINLFTAGCYAIDADKAYAAIEESDSAWGGLIENIKKHIHEDINSLTNEELEGLCKLLDVKQK